MEVSGGLTVDRADTMNAARISVNPALRERTTGAHDSDIATVFLLAGVGWFDIIGDIIYYILAAAGLQHACMRPSQDKARRTERERTARVE